MNDSKRTSVHDYCGHGSIWIIQHFCNAICHNLIGILQSFAPSIQWIDSRKARIKNLFEFLSCVIFELCKLNPLLICNINNELSFTTRVMNRDHASIGQCIRLIKHDECCSKLIHIRNPLDATFLKQSIVIKFNTCQTARM